MSVRQHFSHGTLDYLPLLILVLEGKSNRHPFGHEGNPSAVVCVCQYSVA